MEFTHTWYVFKDGHRLDASQYIFLLECSKSGSCDEWNTWRKNNPESEIWLCGADFRDFNLEYIDLRGAHLEHANFYRCRLRKADLRYTKLNGAYLSSAFLMGVDFEGADLSSIRCRGAACDGETLLWHCTVNKDTDFTGFGLGSARVDPGLRLLLEHNVRRLGWEDWYKRGSILKQTLKNCIVRPFWWVSDYGSSTRKIVAWFTILSISFAFLYFHNAHGNDAFLKNILEYDPETKRYYPEGFSLFIRCLYFSIVTMTTLGFGDIHANARSLFGEILVTVEVLIGYFLLGAIVTRLSILFTSGCPSLSYKQSGTRQENW